MAPTKTQWNTSLTWIASSRMMPHSERSLTTACPKPTVPLEDCQRESLAPPFQKDPGVQGRRRSHPPVRCRDLDFLSEADQATGAVLPSLLALHPGHQTARPPLEQEVLKTASLPSRVHLAPGAAALSWPRHKNGRCTHAQSSRLHRAPRRKA